MRKLFSSVLYAFLSIFIVLLGSFLLSLFIDKEIVLIIIKTSLYTIFVISFGLGLWIKQDKALFLLLLTLLAYIFSQYFALHRFDNNYYGLVAYPLMCILFPINLCLLAYAKQENLFLNSLMRNGILIAGQILIVYFATYFFPALGGEIFFQRFLHRMSNFFYFPLTVESRLTVPIIGIFSFFVFFILSLLLFKKNKSCLNIAFIGIFFVSFISFFNINNAVFFYLSAIVCVLFCLLQISHKMAFLDELTNIPGRRALMNAVNQHKLHPYTLAIMDIDFFKKLNDTYGHEVGDQALRVISARLSQLIHSGSIYRFGGEEFVLFFPYAQLEEVLDEIEEIRSTISTSDFFLSTQRKHSNPTQKQGYEQLLSIHITISAGVAQKTSLETYDYILNIADTALYKAKETGRNKTVYNKDDKFFELF